MRTPTLARTPAVLAVALALPMLLLACESRPGDAAYAQEAEAYNAAGERVRPVAEVLPELRADTSLATATFAGGCFWCLEPPFEKLDGVEAVVSGFAGGTKPNPTYDEVAAGQTDHREAVQVYYDPAVVSYQTLLNAFWRSFNPTDAGGQFGDRGEHYTSAIFAHDARQQALAEASKEDLIETGPFSDPIVTPILPYTNFYPAEDYHQDFYKTNPQRYGSYAEGSGRKPFLRQTWGYDVTSEPMAMDVEWFGEPAPERAGAMTGGAADALVQLASAGDAAATAAAATPLDRWADFEKPSDEELREMLSPIAYHVTQEDGTERAFTGELWDNKAPGIYVDVVSGEPLFSSKDKFRSGTGWPSFTRPLDDRYIVEKVDRTLGMVRTEVRSRYADSHLGHVFEDGPAPTGLRYCMNSAALRFIPADDLEAEGYGEYAARFD